jgi:hypothetical protein
MKSIKGRPKARGASGASEASAAQWGWSKEEIILTTIAKRSGGRVRWGSSLLKNARARE